MALLKPLQPFLPKRPESDSQDHQGHIQFFAVDNDHSTCTPYNEDINQGASGDIITPLWDTVNLFFHKKSGG